MDISAVQRLLRHTDMRTTRRYYEYKTEPLRVKLDQVVDIMEAKKKKVGSNLDVLKKGVEKD
jgi:integrase